MRCRMQIFMGVLLLLNVHFLPAQRVLYSPYVDDRYLLRFEVAGKSGDYYWMQKEYKKRIAKGSRPGAWTIEHSFEIYDERMNLVNIVSPLNTPNNTIKEYLV